ncbi:MAG: FtsQ-type POTRA domain-containing protein [Candidatus Aureabacteria bacterium]|nr:FtsQ-type POTRA domain-containing protein [Candidatus Auribacterota bacterium]
MKYMKARKYNLLPFGKGSSCSKKPYRTKTLHARMSRKKMTSLVQFFRKSLVVLFVALKIVGYSMLFFPMLIIMEEVYKGFLSLDDFQIKKVEVTGNCFVSNQKILEKAAISEEDTLLNIDLRKKAEEISCLLVVKDVEIKKHFPGNILISVTERDPFFISSEKKVLLDEDGIKLPFEPESYNVPSIIGFNYDKNGNIVKTQLDLYKESVKAIRHFYSIGDKIPLGIQSVIMKSRKCIVITFSDKTEVKFPIPVKNKHLERLIYVYNDLNKKDISFKSIDLTFQNVVVKRDKDKKS